MQRSCNEAADGAHSIVMVVYGVVRVFRIGHVWYKKIAKVDYKTTTMMTATTKYDERGKRRQSEAREREVQCA